MGIFPMAVGDDPPLLVEQLVSRGDTLAGLERLLQLSPGYLSKVRRGRVTASAQLIALLRVLARHPEVRETLRAPVGTTARALEAALPTTFQPPSSAASPAAGRPQGSASMPSTICCFRR